MATYRLARAAADDLVNIYLTGVEVFGVGQAELYQDGIAAVFDFLAAHPRAARLRHELRPPVRAYPYKAHLIVYRVEAHDDVHVLRIRHARENWTHDI